MTAVPAAIDGLLALVRASSALGGAGVRVDDGPWLSRPQVRDVVVIGWLPIRGPTVAWVEDPAGLASATETFDIHGLVSTWHEDMALKPVRDRADGLLEEIRAVVRANQTLGGAVSTARVAALHMTPALNTTGAIVSLEFVVQCRVF